MEAMSLPDSPGFFHFTGGGANSQGLSPAPAQLPHRPGNKYQEKNIAKGKFKAHDRRPSTGSGLIDRNSEYYSACVDFIQLRRCIFLVHEKFRAQDKNVSMLCWKSSLEDI
jgi:hypothetical protein